MKELDAIFFAAWELPPEDRPAYLTEVCGSDGALRSRVEEMLAISRAAETFIPDAPEEDSEDRKAERAFLKTPKGEPADEPDEVIGQKIGRYKILERIGEGGFGVVYVAEQIEPVRRRVALKVIKLGMDSKQVVARFEAERQALAMMEHPNIAKIFDAGAVGRCEVRREKSEVAHPSPLAPHSSSLSGRPYFVMELVRGVPITDYCDQANLTTSQRLDLFIKVCHGIQHAHQKGIIHRDVKPSNILVTLHDGVPVPKVIDFGIAKATSERLTDATIYTQLHQFIGTPAYISPEQAEMSALDIDTRSDIYSLGVLLYELLTGKTPFDARDLMSQGIDAMRRTIREKEPTRPSTKLARLDGKELTTVAQRRNTEAPRLLHQLRGDLDWIVMKCLEKDRMRRYGTANGLADDLKRHLTNEPVLACPPSAAYRLGKAFRRNKIVFISCLAVAVALLLGLVGSTWQAVEATRARKAAQHAQAHATAQQKKAEAEKQRAEEQLARAGWLLYASKLMLAQTDFDTANGGLALHYLSECQQNLRGWEHRYLSTRINAKLTLQGHVRAVSTAAFSPDGQRIVTGSEDRTAKVWDATTGEPLLILKGDRYDIYGAAFSPDGRRVVTVAGEDGDGITPGDAKVWDVATGRPLFDLKGHKYSVFGTAFSPDGRRIVTAASERSYRGGEVKVWDAVAGQELLTLPYTESVRCVAFSPDGQRIVTGGLAQVKVWDAATGGLLVTLKGHTFVVTSVAFSPDGERIVSSSWDKTARVWNASTGRETLAFKGHSDVVTSAAFSPDGQRIATGSWDKTVRIWEAQTAQEILTLKGHGLSVRSVAFSPDGKRVVTSSEDKTARVWDAERGQEIPTVRAHADFASSIAFSPDGEHFVTGGADGIAKVWDTASGREVLSLGTKHPYWQTAGVWSVAFSPDGQRILTGCQDKSAKVWDAKTGQELLDLAHTNAVLGVAFSPDGSRIVAGVGWYGEPRPRPGEVKIWDTATGQLRLTFHHLHPAWSVAFSPDGKRLVTGSAVGDVRLWDAVTGQELGQEFFARKAHKGGVGGVAFSSNGQRLVSGGYDNTAKVWDAGTGQELLTLKGHTGHLLCVAFSPDGERIVTGSEDGTAKIWETGLGQEVFSFKGHGKPVRGVAFSPDGQWLMIAADVLVRVWSGPPPTAAREQKNPGKEWRP